MPGKEENAQQKQEKGNGKRGLSSIPKVGLAVSDRYIQTLVMLAQNKNIYKVKKKTRISFSLHQKHCYTEKNGFFWAMWFLLTRIGKKTKSRHQKRVFSEPQPLKRRFCYYLLDVPT